jgi:hypothetical protein
MVRWEEERQVSSSVPGEDGRGVDAMTPQRDVVSFCLSRPS